MMCLPAGRFLTMPFPPFPFAARRFAAVILPPRLFLAMFSTWVSVYFVLPFAIRRSRGGPGNRFWASDPLIASGNDEEYDSENDGDQAVDQPEALRVGDRRHSEEYDSNRPVDVTDDRPRCPRSSSDDRGGYSR